MAVAHSGVERVMMYEVRRSIRQLIRDKQQHAWQVRQRADVNMSQQVSQEAPHFAKWPYPAADEIDAAMRALRSGKVNYHTGEQGRLFEAEFAQFIGCKHAIALATGTVALATALNTLGLGPGDELITTNRTLIAMTQCAVALGARPVIADVDHESQNLTAETIRPMITPRSKVIVAVHLAGWPCEMDGIMQLAQERGLKVVEDCAQALGTRYKGRPVGSIGDLAAFSFCPDGIMTTGGEGGMLTTNMTELWQLASGYQENNGRDAVHNHEYPNRSRCLPELLETNGRMTEVQSAIGRVALKKVPSWVETRRKYAAIFNEKLAGLRGLRLALPQAHSYHAYYKYYVFVRPEHLRPGWSRDRILQAICAEGVPCSVGSCDDAYRKKAFLMERRSQARLPVAKELRECSLMFLVHPTLEAENIQYACRVIEKVVAEATTPGNRA